MDSTHAVKVLREHNEWRRGNRLETWDCMPYSPAELGAAIDSVCAALSERDRMLWEAVEILNKSTTQLAIAASSFRGQDMTRKEVLADETSAIMREGLAFLSAYDASKKWTDETEIFPGTSQSLANLSIKRKGEPHDD